MIHCLCLCAPSSWAIANQRCAKPRLQVLTQPHTYICVLIVLLVVVPQLLPFLQLCDMPSLPLVWSHNTQPQSTVGCPSQAVARWTGSPNSQSGHRCHNRSHRLLPTGLRCRRGQGARVLGAGPTTSCLFRTGSLLSLAMQCTGGVGMFSTPSEHAPRCSEMRAIRHCFHLVSGLCLDAVSRHWLEGHVVVGICSVTDMWEVNEAILQMSNTNNSMHNRPRRDGETQQLSNVMLRCPQRWWLGSEVAAHGG